MGAEDKAGACYFLPGRENSDRWDLLAVFTSLAASVPRVDRKLRQPYPRPGLSQTDRISPVLRPRDWRAIRRACAHHTKPLPFPHLIVRPPPLLAGLRSRHTRMDPHCARCLSRYPSPRGCDQSYCHSARAGRVCLGVSWT